MTGDAWNIPNSLTLLRILLIPVFVGLMLYGWYEPALAVLLGDPVFARVIPCERSRDLCVATRRGRPSILAQAARDPVRWGSDSVAFFTTGDLLQVRPLSRGRPRLLHLSNPPARPRQPTFFEGRAEAQPPADQM